jgi:hypothetical protein
MTIKAKFDRNGNLKKVVGNVGQTRMNRAALELWKGHIEPTTGYKLRRFIKRFFLTLKSRYYSALAFHEEISAAEIPTIGLLPDEVRQ